MSLSPVRPGGGAQSPDVSMPSIRMKLDNTFASIQEDGKSANMKVYARVRPMLQKEEDAGYLECVGVIDEQVVRAIVPSSSAKYKNASQNGQEIYEDFTYTEALGPEVGQFVFFRKTVMDIMQGFIEGQNCLLFSYGITNSGKTYTLQGTEADPGIIPLAMKLFFASIKHQLFDGISVKPDKFADILMLGDKEIDLESQLKDHLMQLSDKENADKTNATASMKKSLVRNWCDCFDDDFEFETEESLPAEEMKAAQSAMYMKDLSKQSADQQEGMCSIWISFVEIYNEYIYDLLQPNVLNRAKLNLGEDQNGDVYVKGAREICVSSSEEALKLLSLGRRNLRVAATKLNYQSSRSHCIYTVKVVRMFDEENGRVNRISFCDLAGSERAAKSQTVGIHLKEAGYINTSILVLGKCLDQLRLNQSLRDKKMIPIRESKLTRLFSGHFFGKGRTVMIANASPCEYTFDETLNVLRFSALLKTVKLNDSYLSTVSTSLASITNQFTKSKANLSMSVNESNLDVTFSEDIQERDEMIEKLLDLADSLRSNLEKEKTEKAELESKIRQELFTQAAEDSDRLLAEQKRISDNYIQDLKELHETRVSNLKAAHAKEVAELRAQIRELEEEESCLEESSMSIKNENSTMDVEDRESSKILFASPAPNKNYSFASPVPVMDTERIVKSESGSKAAVSTPLPAVSLNEKVHLEEIKSLQEQLELVTKELEAAKEELELSSGKLKTAESEASLAIEECSSLKENLRNAESTLESKAKELDVLKSESLEKDHKLESLMSEQKSFEENTRLLAEKISTATSTINQLLEDQRKSEESHSQELKQYKQEIAEASDSYKELQQKFEGQESSLDDMKVQFSELESMYVAVNTDKSKLEAEKKELEEKLSSALKQLENGDVESKIQLLNQQLEDAKRLLEEQESNFKLLQEEYAALKKMNSELTTSLDAEKENHRKLIVEHDEAKSEIEVLKEKMTTERDVHSKEIDESKSNLFESQERCSELLHELEERNSKLSKFELDCEEYQTKNEELLKNIQRFEEECSQMADKLTSKEKCPETEFEMESILVQLGEAKLKNSSLEEKCSDVSSQLQKALQENEGNLLKISNLENKLEELNSNLENSNIQIAELNSKIGELESECDSYKKTKECDLDLAAELEAWKTKCELHKTNYDKVYENYQTVELAFSTLNKENGSLRTEYEGLQQERLSAEAQNKCVKDLEQSIAEKEAANQELTENLENSLRDLKNKDFDIATYKTDIAKLTEELEEAKSLQKQAVVELEKVCAKNEEHGKKIAELEEIVSETENKIQDFLENIESYKAEIEEKEVEIGSYKETIESLKAKLEKATVLEEQSVELDEVSAKIDDYEKTITELLESLSEKETTIKELTDTVADLKIEIENKENGISSYREELDTIKANLEKAQLFQEQSVQFEEISAKNVELEKKIADMEECLSEKEATIDELKEKVQTLESCNADIQRKEVEIASYQEEIANLKGELEKAKLLQEQSDLLCLSTQRCEFVAHNKIKFLDSSIVKHQGEIKDMKREIKEKTDSIGELEKALGDSQKQMKDMHAKMAKQVEEKRQDASRIEQILFEKKVVETENHKLKISLAQAQEKEMAKAAEEVKENAKSTKEEASISPISKGKKKRSLSDMTKEANEDIENSKPKHKVQDKKPSKTTKAPVKKDVLTSAENETLPKRKRVLRTQQPKAVDLDDTLESEQESDDEYVPEKKTSKSSLRQKKTKGKEVEPPKQRTSRRKLQEQQENMSPVKKAMQFMGSKIRSVAQSVSSMPSPRVTRGRKKLFNADAPEPKWRP